MNKRAAKTVAKVVVPKNLQPTITTRTIVSTTDPITKRDAEARVEKGRIMVKIGCRDYTLAQWRKRGEAIVRLEVTEEAPCDCSYCMFDPELRAEAETLAVALPVKRARVLANLHTFLDRAQRELRIK